MPCVWQAGILALEELLLAANADRVGGEQQAAGGAGGAGSAKRSRRGATSQPRSAALAAATTVDLGATQMRDGWRQLAELYKQVDETDVRNGVLAQHVASVDETKLALAASASGSHTTAVRHYTKALEREAARIAAAVAGGSVSGVKRDRASLEGGGGGGGGGGDRRA